MWDIYDYEPELTDGEAELRAMREELAHAEQTHLEFDQRSEDCLLCEELRSRIATLLGFPPLPEEM